MRIMTLQIYFKNTPHPWTFENVTSMVSEGGFLRIIQNRSENQWFPINSIFRIIEKDRKEVPLMEKTDVAKEN